MEIKRALSEVHLEPKYEKDKDMRINVPKNRLASFHNVHQNEANAFVVAHQVLEKLLGGGRGLCPAGGQIGALTKNFRGLHTWLLNHTHLAESHLV